MNKKLIGVAVSLCLVLAFGTYALSADNLTTKFLRGYTTKDLYNILRDLEDDITTADTGVQTITPGTNLSNSGTAKNPILDLDISEDVNMDTNQVTHLAAPAAPGEAIRQTDKITESKLEDADDKKHSQNTDTDLDATFEATFMKKADNVNELADITSAGADIEDAVTKKHTQGTDQKLDDGGANEVTAAELRTHVDNLTKHREIDDSSTADTKLWSANKINTELHWVDEVPLPFRMTWDDGDTYLQHFQIRVGEGNCADTGIYVVDKESKDDQANWVYFSPNNIVQIPAEGIDYLHNHLMVQYTTGQSVLSKNTMYNIWKRVYNATDSVYGDWDWLGSIIK